MMNDTSSFGLGLFTASSASAVWKWAVFSPTIAGGWFLPDTEGPPNLPAAYSPVQSGWVDNAWDTQRRRGLEATARTVFT